jgi:DNA-binding winged helix-turn-helix (wHTH) protein
MSLPPADRFPENAAGPIDLAATPAFRLGPLEVRPSTREVRGEGGGERIAEPRVLQVLVALSQAGGAVVSRDTLVQRCWEGRFVGEDAINRAIAKARQLADLASPPAFAIETIPRVGYRLRVGAPGAHEPAAPRAPTAGGLRLPRRGLIAGGAVAAGAAALVGLGAYRWLRPAPKADPLVAVLPFDNLSPDPQMGYFADGLS